ncbi:MAG: anthranilate phosphoribosyltransferase [Dehalococcoidia bacterium]
MTALQDAIRALADDGRVSDAQAAAALEVILAGAATAAQIGAFLTGLRMQGEPPSLIAACLQVTQRHAEYVPADNVMDIVGTGGDGIDTFNVSTAAALVVAGAGVRVAKHGNRAASSKCGSADVLEALGARLDIGGARAAAIIDACGFCFLFAQRFHPAFRHVGPARRELGIRTIFNLLGPLANPAHPRRMLVGVSIRALGPVLAETFRLRGLDRVMVVHSAEGLDEISPALPTQAWVVDGGPVVEMPLLPETFGLLQHPLERVAGGDAAENAAIMNTVLGGERGAMRDFVLMNAAAALWVAGAAKDFMEGAHLAAESIDSGRARETLNRYVALSQEGAAGG